MKLFESKGAKRLLLILLILIILVVGAYAIAHGNAFFSRSAFRTILRFIRSYGSFSPLAVIFLIMLSTAIPPLPLPIPLVEIVAGLIFGFWQGFLIVWLSQILSSILAFSLSRYFGGKLFGTVLNNHIWNLYQKFLHKRGPLAVFIIRATMAAPFNVISYLAGLTQMKLGEFSGATTLGVVPEAVLFTFIGSKLRIFRFNLSNVLILVVILGVLGWLLTLVTMKILQPKIKSEVKS